MTQCTLVMVHTCIQLGATMQSLRSQSIHISHQLHSCSITEVHVGYT